MKRQVNLHIEKVPNPNAIKIVLENGILTDQPYEFRDFTETSASPLAQKLMMLRYVERVMINRNYVTILKTPKDTTEWEKVYFDLRSIVQEHLANNEAIMYVGSEALDHQKSDDVVVTMVKDLLDKFIRPAAQEDGGDIVFHEYEKGVLTVAMHGACHQCPYILKTLKEGVEPMLQNLVPEVREVKPKLIS
jgi:Fe-S cluster biogenesis protein NfuA